MKSLIKAVIVGTALVASAGVFAQSNAPVTRAQVRAELIQLQQAGYHVGDGDQAHYPDAVQAAEARVAAQAGNGSGFGGRQVGASESGRGAVSAADWQAMYSR